MGRYLVKTILDLAHLQERVSTVPYVMTPAARFELCEGGAEYPLVAGGRSVLAACQKRVAARTNRGPNERRLRIRRTGGDLASCGRRFIAVRPGDATGGYLLISTGGAVLPRRRQQHHAPPRSRRHQLPRLPLRLPLLDERPRSLRVVLALLDHLEVAGGDLLGLRDGQTEALEDRHLGAPHRERSVGEEHGGELACALHELVVGH